MKAQLASCVNSLCHFCAVLEEPVVAIGDSSTFTLLFCCPQLRVHFTSVLGLFFKFLLPPPSLPPSSPQGKLELELEIVTEEEEQLRPAAKSRDDPNMNPMLDPPK